MRDFFLLGVPPRLSVIRNMAATAAASVATSEFNQDETHFDFFHAFAAVPLLPSPRLTPHLPAPLPLIPSHRSNDAAGGSLLSGFV